MKYLKTFENNFDLNSWEDEERPYESTPEDISIFYEELSKTGAAEKGQIFGKIGLDHGMQWDLGQIYGLATS